MGDRRNQTSCSSPTVLASPEIFTFLFCENDNIKAESCPVKGFLLNFFKNLSDSLRGNRKICEGRPEDNLAEHNCAKYRQPGTANYEVYALYRSLETIQHLKSYGQ